MGTTAVLFCKVILRQVKERERKEKKGKDGNGNSERALLSRGTLYMSSHLLLTCSMEKKQYSNFNNKTNKDK